MTTKVLKVLKASTWPFPTRTYMEVGTLAKFEISMKVAKKKVTRPIIILHWGSKYQTSLVSETKSLIFA